MAKVDEREHFNVILVNFKDAQLVRRKIEALELWDSSRRLQKFNNEVAIPILLNEQKTKLLSRELENCLTIPFRLTWCDLPASKVAKIKSPYERLLENLTILMECEATENILKTLLLKEVPKSWEKHGDLILMPEYAFSSDKWRQFGEQLWVRVTDALCCKRLARKSTVSRDCYRTPQVELLYGLDGMVCHVDNGIVYSYDITKCMFSAGNVTEKLRVAQFDCKHEVVVDLYAGIGYFTLPYLVHAGAAYVHACEWNPYAVEALRQNLKLNNAENRCTVYHGDNRKVCPQGIADRVNLGLIPSSRQGWLTACRALKPHSGGILHIHENVTSFPSANGTSSPSGDDTSFPSANGTSFPSANGTLILLDDYKKISQSTDRHSEIRHQDSDCSVDHSVPDKLTNENQDNLCQFAPLDVQNSNENNVPSSVNAKSHRTVIKSAWITWSEVAKTEIKSMLKELHMNEWLVKVLHIEHVKSYAPHVDHLVLDLMCTPS